MSRILVTGAAGFIGAALATQLISDGNHVVTIDNLSTGDLENLPEGIEFINGDVGDANVYQDLEHEPVEVIFHIAGQSSGEISFDDPLYDLRTNAQSTLLLLEYCRRVGCERFIYASTMSVYGSKEDRPTREDSICAPKSFYGVGKLASEHYLDLYQQFGIDTTALRLFNVYGPGQNMNNLKQGMVSIYLAQLLESKSILVKGSKERYRDFVYIEDVVRSFKQCLENKKSVGEIINIGTGIRTTVRELLISMVSHFTEEISIHYEGQTSGDIMGIYADIRKMDDLLGRWDKTDLSLGLKKMIAFYQ